MIDGAGYSISLRVFGVGDIGHPDFVSFSFLRKKAGRRLNENKDDV